MAVDRRRERLARRLVYVVVIALVGTATLRLIQGNVTYTNYWGGLVFAPFAVVIGVLVVVAMEVRRRRLERRRERR